MANELLLDTAAVVSLRTVLAEDLGTSPVLVADHVSCRESFLACAMTLSEFETKKVEKAVLAFLEKRRPPPHIRPKLDFGYRIAGQSIELFEIRPRWDKPSDKLEHPFAKATYVKTTGTWKVFWRRADLKWHGYEPAPHVGSVEKFLKIVDEDTHACFFG